MESVVVKKQPIDKLSPIEFPPFAMITDGVLSLPTSVSFKPIAPVHCGIRSNETCILSREYIVSIYIYIYSLSRGKKKEKKKQKGSSLTETRVGVTRPDTRRGQFSIK